MAIDKPSALNWNAHWIWNDGEESPRNEWWCFRKTFELPAAGWDEAGLAITADSRYVLYVNGEQVGRGPVRSWPFEQAYDIYEVGHLLKPGQMNCIAVMVLHFGVSTFYYVAGRGGLLAQLDLWVGGKVAGGIGSNGTWKIARYSGQDPRAPRMSCQQAFAERIDARGMDDTWMQTGFADGSWQSAAVIGIPGMSPWVELKPRDIPHLTEEPVSPVRVEALNKVRPLTWTTCIDARVQMDPASERHANAIAYAGYIAGVLRVPWDVSAVIGFPYAPPNMNGLIVNGNRYGKKDFRSVQSEKYLSVDLKAGDNLVLVELVGQDHGRGVFMGLDCGTEFEWLPLLPEDVVSPEHSPFVSLGPFEPYEYIDHQHSEAIVDKERTLAACAGKQGAEEELNDEQLGKVSAFRKAGECRTPQELAALAEWLRPVSLRLYSPESVLALSIWKKGCEPLPVPASLQNAVTANPEAAAVPLFPDADTEIIIDFGRELTGFLTFKLNAAEGTLIDWYGFEYMRDDWVQHTYYLENTLRYICREGRQRYISPIRRGLRYVAVTVRGAGRPVKLYNVQMRQSHYPVADVGQFRCSDALLDDIWEISKYTTKLCMEDTFVDCPAYEQTFWVGDSRNEALIGYYVFGGEAIVKRCLDLVPGSRTQTPLYADQVPSGWSSVIPNWTFFWSIACLEYFERTGDKEYARTVWPHVRYTLDSYLKLLDERGLLNMQAWNFLDWAPIDQPRNGIVTHQNLYFARALRCAAELARTAGEREQSAKYCSATEALVQAINDHLWSEEKQAYLDCIHATDGNPTFSACRRRYRPICARSPWDSVKRYWRRTC